MFQYWACTLPGKTHQAAWWVPVHRMCPLNLSQPSMCFGAFYLVHFTTSGYLPGDKVWFNAP